MPPHDRHACMIQRWLLRFVMKVCRTKLFSNSVPSFCRFACGAKNSRQPRFTYIFVGGRSAHTAYRYATANAAKMDPTAYVVRAQSKYRNHRDPRRIIAAMARAATRPARNPDLSKYFTGFPMHCGCQSCPRREMADKSCRLM